MESLENTSLDYAITNMRQFVAELIDTFGELEWQYIGGGDKPRHNNGWYAFELVIGKEVVAIDMPGCDPRLFHPDADMLTAPQIFINGSPWQYGFALSHTDTEVRNIIVDQWIRENKKRTENAKQSEED